MYDKAMGMKHTCLEVKAASGITLCAKAAQLPKRMSTKNTQPLAPEANISPYHYFLLQCTV